MSNEGSWIDQAEHDAQKASGGGGIVAQCEINRGYKVFVAGLGNRESFFAFDPTNESSKKAALGKAQSSGGKPQDAIELVVYKTSVKGREVTWKDDRFFTYPLWTDAFKTVFLPAVKEHKPPLSKKFWGKVSFAPDPSGRKKKEPNPTTGELENELVAFVSQVYASEAEASADASTASTNGNGQAEVNDPMVPADYSKADWLSMKQDVADAVNAAIREAEAKTKGKPKPVIAKAVEAAKSEAIATKATELAASVEQVNALLAA